MGGKGGEGTASTLRGEVMEKGKGVLKHPRKRKNSLKVTPKGYAGTLGHGRRVKEVSREG